MPWVKPSGREKRSKRGGFAKDIQHGRARHTVIQQRRRPVELLLASASDAADDPTLATDARRADLLEHWADALYRHRRGLVGLAKEETNLPEAALAAELIRAVEQLRFLAAHIVTNDFRESTVDIVVTAPGGTPTQISRFLIPLGPCLVFEASNFPFAFGALGNDVASAIAAGNPVLLKVHEAHQQTSLAVVSLARALLDRLGFNPGTLNAIVAQADAMHALRDSRIAATGFTGSLAAGRVLREAVLERPNPTPFFGEFGSINPVIVTPDAMRERGPQLLEEFVECITIRAGQLCTKPGLLMLPRQPDTRSHLQSLIRSVPPQPMLNESMAIGFMRQVELRRASPGVEIIQAERSPEAKEYVVAANLFLTSVEDLSPDSPLKDECFGPAAVISEYDTLESATALVNTIHGSLTGTVHTLSRDTPEARAAVSALTRVSGRVVINGWPTGVATSRATQHGGPWPSSSEASSTSIGTASIRRWMRPIAFQGGHEAGPES